MKHRLAWYDYITINLFWLGLNIRNNAIGSIFLPFLIAGFVGAEMKNTALGLLSGAGLVIAMLVQPAAGLLSDRSTSRFGRRRPFIFVGVLLDLVFMTAISLAGSYDLLLIATLFQQFSANLSHGPLQGLIPDLVPEDQRGRASAVKSIFELLPLLILAFTISKMVGNGQVGLAFIATGGGLLLVMLLTMIFVKEEPLTVKPNTPLWPTMARVLGVLLGIFIGGLVGLVSGGVIGGIFYLAGQALNSVGAQVLGLGIGGAVAMAVAVVAGVWTGATVTLGQRPPGQSPLAWFTMGGLSALLRDLFPRPAAGGSTPQNGQANTAFTWWVINRLFFLAAITAIQAFAPFFLMFAFKITREAAASTTGNLLLVVGVCTMVTAIPAGALSDRFGRKFLVGFSGGLAAVGAFMLLLTIYLPNMTLLYIIGGILGLATGLFNTTNWALGTDLVPKAEAGRYLGISNLAGAGAGMIGRMIGGPVIDAINALTPGMGYFSIFAGYGVLFLLSTLTLGKVRASK